jgi:response regulator NasT
MRDEMMPRKHVVIVDDSPRSRVTLGSTLTRLGFEVAGEATKGIEAVRLVRGLKSDVLFLVVGLPDMDGLTAAASILETLPLPILILSSHLDQKLIQRAKEVGVMAYLLKPLRQEELLPAIELAISRFEEFNALRKENADLKRILFGAGGDSPRYPGRRQYHEYPSGQDQGAVSIRLYRQHRRTRVRHGPR